MVTFTEEILNGKLYFLISVIALSVLLFAIVEVKYEQKTKNVITVKIKCNCILSNSLSLNLEGKNLSDCMLLSCHVRVSE